MTSALIHGIAAAIPAANLDTDQIMPKQFLRGIDKSGLAAGLLWDLRFHGDGRPRPDFVLNRPDRAGARILVAGTNFGCGSSREHAVWGLQQFGIEAVIASSYGEIFYSNAMNNRLPAIVLEEEQVQALCSEAQGLAPIDITVDLQAMVVRSPRHCFAFTLSERYRRMLLEDIDSIGLSLACQPEIDAFTRRHWAAHPWLKDLAKTVRDRLSSA